MSMCSILTEDMDTLDSESLHSPMGPPTSSISSPSPITEHLREDKIENTIPLRDVVSFLPILLTLPNWVLSDGAYQMQGGHVSQEHLEQLSAYTQGIGGFTLTDKLTPQEDPIAPGTINRLFQLYTQHNNKPLFPSLNRLQIIDADSSLAQFWSFLLTPSLKALEVAGVSESHQSALVAFLNTLAVDAPELSSIKLGPGLISLDSMKTCAGFSHLVELHFSNVAVPFDFSLLEQIGNLSNLETFKLDVPRLSLYSSKSKVPKHPPAIPASTSPVPGPLHSGPYPDDEKRPGDKWYPDDEKWCPGDEKRPDDKKWDLDDEKWCPGDEKRPDDKKWYEKRPDDKNWCPDDEKRSNDEPPFSWGRGPIVFDTAPQHSWDLKGKPGSPPSTPGRYRSPSPSEASAQEAMSPLIPFENLPSDTPELASNISWYIADEVPSPPAPGFRQLKKLHIVGTLALMQDIIDHISSTELKDVSLTLLAASPSAAPAYDRPPSPPIQTKKKKKLINVKPTLTNKISPTPPSNVVVLSHEDSSFEFLLDRILSGWTTTLTSISIHQQGGTFVEPIHPLSAAILERLLSHARLEHLEISSWNIAAIKNGGEAQLKVGQHNLRVLHLPIDATSAISLNRLRLLVKACPNLVSLRCAIKHLSNIPDDDTIAGPNSESDQFTHKLEELSVGNKLPHDDPQRLLLVAQYLDTLFPNLKKIETHDNYNAPQWKYIHDLIKMCQKSRLNHSS